MANNVTRDDFQHLETRVTVVEQEVEGEKLVTRHILEQTRRNGDDLAAVKAEQKLQGADLSAVIAQQKLQGADLAAVKAKLQGVDLKGLVKRVDGLDRKVDDLTKNLPRIVGDVMREVLRERDG